MDVDDAILEAMDDIEDAYSDDPIVGGAAEPCGGAKRKRQSHKADRRMAALHNGGHIRLCAILKQRDSRWNGLLDEADGGALTDVLLQSARTDGPLPSEPTSGGDPAHGCIFGLALMREWDFHDDPCNPSFVLSDVDASRLCQGYSIEE